MMPTLPPLWTWQQRRTLDGKVYHWASGPNDEEAGYHDGESPDVVAQQAWERWSAYSGLTRAQCERATDSSLTFDEFALVNQRRCAVAFAEQCGDWGEVDWSNALCGESGEYANIIKKRRRGDKSLRSKHAAALELADIVTYAFLCADSLEIHLEPFIIQKFNTVSDRMGCDIKIAS